MTIIQLILWALSWMSVGALILWYLCWSPTSHMVLLLSFLRALCSRSDTAAGMVRQPVKVKYDRKRWTGAHTANRWPIRNMALNLTDCNRWRYLWLPRDEIRWILLDMRVSVFIWCEPRKAYYFFSLCNEVKIFSNCVDLSFLWILIIIWQFLAVFSLIYWFFLCLNSLG